jgi:coenzyme F420-dependent oxidoreductase
MTGAAPMTDADLDLLLSVGDHPSLDSVAEQTIHAEEMGFARVSLGETTGWNAVTTLTCIGERTESIGLSNDVFSPYSRSPALLGQTAAGVQEVTGGRYRLGLGPSSPALVEGWHGDRFERPLRRVRETIEIVRAVLSGERVSYDGEVFDLDGLALGCPTPESETPIDLSVLGPKATELAGRFADGWVPQLFTPKGLSDRLADLDRGADLGGRESDELRVSPILRCCAMDDGAAAREHARESIAFLIGAYGPYYRQSIAAQGHEDVARAIREAWEAGERDRMAAELPDDLLEDLVAAGTPEEVRATIERFADIGGVDAVRVGFLTRGSIDEQYRTMEAIAPLCE